MEMSIVVRRQRQPTTTNDKQQQHTPNLYHKNLYGVI